MSFSELKIMKRKHTRTEKQSRLHATNKVFILYKLLLCKLVIIVVSAVVVYFSGSVG